MEKCDNCGAYDRTLSVACGDCNNAFYCNAQCGDIHFNTGHKFSCSINTSSSSDSSSEEEAFKPLGDHATLRMLQSEMDPQSVEYARIVDHLSGRGQKLSSLEVGSLLDKFKLQSRKFKNSLPGRRRKKKELEQLEREEDELEAKLKTVRRKKEALQGKVFEGSYKRKKESLNLKKTLKGPKDKRKGGFFRRRES